MLAPCYNGTIMSSMPLSVDLNMGKLDYTFLPFEVGIEVGKHGSICGCMFI